MPREFVLPGQPTKYARDLTFKIEHTKLEVELFFDTRSLRARVAHRLRPIANPIRFLELDAAELAISSVKVNEKKVEYQTGPTTIRIDLGSELAPDSAVEVEIDYSGTPKKGLYFRVPTKEHPETTVHAFTQGQAEDTKYWMPCYDYPNMKATFEAFVTAPGNMTAVSNGELVSVRDATGGKKLWHFSEEVPHSSYLHSLVVGEYEKMSEARDRVAIEYYVPAAKKDLSSRSFQKTPKMMAFFGKFTGEEYPYPKYAQTVVADFMFGGMENITATTLTDRTLHDERAHLDFQSENLVSHELAHQWFGDLITCKDWSHAWLNEGFATYFNALFREVEEGANDFQYTMYGNWEKVQEEVDERYERRIVENRYWHADELFDSHTYEKGSWVIHGIRGILGDRLFQRVIQHYVAKNRAANVETGDFRKALETISGLNFERFFEQWLYSPGFPDYVASYSFEESAALAKVEVEQKNAGEGGVPLFSNPIDLVFTFADGSTKLTKIVLPEKKSSFFFSLQSKPVNVSLDPGNFVLKNLKFQKPKEMSLYQLRNDPNARERVRAASELSEFRTDDVVEALAGVVDSEEFWWVRLEAAKNLGKIGREGALNALLQRVSNKDHRVRRGIAMGLAYFGEMESEAPVDALIKFLDYDESYYVRAYAGESLGSYRKSERAFEAMRSALTQDSINDQIRYRTFLGFEGRRDKRALELAKKYLVEPGEHNGRIGAARVLGKLGKGDPEAARTLLSMEKEPNIYVRDGAALALAFIQDPALIPQIEEWLSREPVGKVKRSLREAIFASSQDSAQTERLAKLEQDLQRANEETRKLSDRLATIESKPKTP
jgi:aminopeptidase N